MYKKALKDLKTTGALVYEPPTSDQLITFLNTRLIASDESTPTSAVKVSHLFDYGHGTKDKMVLNWGWGKEYHDLSKNEVIDIKTKAFDLRVLLFYLHAISPIVLIAMPLSGLRILDKRR